ncbi:ATP-binding protein [Natrinema versiforme]|uniref:histidine kinase n=1 Tax=Natrinema versiforme JCM 10478 TaxID=1227496 RepID=L9XPB2_9EURY|nr:ATP-binding protein [Natrinema versiforme]ELY63595.1 GAF sensor signal transduction histidine kinase [Natrinema versiforme JCM 10478]
MSDTTTALFEDTSETAPRVLPLISNEGNRNLLSRWVETHESFEYVPFEEDMEAVEFDVCILDEGALHQHQTELARVKEEAQPVLIPSLLLVPESASERSGFDLENSMNADILAPVDEITSLPVNQGELEWRVRTLLRLREQSLQAYTSGRRYREAKEQLHQIIRKNVPFDQKAREAIELGARYLDTDVGILNRIDEETGYLEASITANITDGETIEDIENDLSKAYCRKTIKGDDPLPIHDALEQGWGNDPAFKSSGDHTYLGTPLIIDEEPYGTVCFVGKKPRSEPFSETETRFAEHLTRLLERELDRDILASRLTNQTNLSKVLNRVLRHNLRNDISVIRGYVEILADQADDDDTVETALNSIDGLIDLTEKARQLEAIVSTNADRRNTEMGSFIENLVEPLAQEYPDASISVEYDDEICVSVLQTFDRALEELVENAVKHSGDQPTVTVEIEAVPNAVEIRIHDDGPGLPEQEAKVLQEGVETSLAHGSGLGLWLAYWITDSHDGTISSDITDNGTTITVSIPHNPTAGVQQQLTEFTKTFDKYQVTFEQANDLMIILNDEGQILEANPTAGALLKVEQQELIGRPFRDFLPDGLDYDARWKEFLQTGDVPETLTIIDADGNEQIHKHTATADIIPGQHLFIGRDVTKRQNNNKNCGG